MNSFTFASSILILLGILTGVAVITVGIISLATSWIHDNFTGSGYSLFSSALSDFEDRYSICRGYRQACTVFVVLAILFACQYLCASIIMIIPAARRAPPLVGSLLSVVLLVGIFFVAIAYMIPTIIAPHYRSCLSVGGSLSLGSGYWLTVVGLIISGVGWIVACPITILVGTLAARSRRKSPSSAAIDVVPAVDVNAQLQSLAGAPHPHTAPPPPPVSTGPPAAPPVYVLHSNGQRVESGVLSATASPR